MSFGLSCYHPPNRHDWARFSSSLLPLFQVKSNKFAVVLPPPQPTEYYHILLKGNACLYPGVCRRVGGPLPITWSPIDRVPKVSPLHHSLECRGVRSRLSDIPWHKIPQIMLPTLLDQRSLELRTISGTVPVSHMADRMGSFPVGLQESHKEGTSPRHPHPARLFTFPHDTGISDG